MDIRFVLLIIGAVSGVLLAAINLISDTNNVAAWPNNAAARVADRTISVEDYTSQLNNLAAGKRNPLSETDRQRALDRLIEEELLILRGLEVGLVYSVPNVRKAITAAMINQIVSESAALQPEKADLELFYQENKALFTRPDRLRVQHLRMIQETTATEAYQRLQGGESFAKVHQALGSHTALILPNVMLPPMKIGEYIGPTLMQRALAMKPGEYSLPEQVGNAWHILYLVDKEQNQPLEFADITNQVAFEYRRQLGNKALRDYLQWLKQRTDVEIAPDLFEPAD